MNARRAMLRKMVYGKSWLRMLAAKNSRKHMSVFSPDAATIAGV
jgi:hypothetical protein